MRVYGDEVAEINDDVAASSRHDRLEVHVYRDGELLHEQLVPAQWNINWLTGRSTHGQGTFIFADPSGSLQPWSITDALAPGGSLLNIFYVFGATGHMVPLGWWRIRNAVPTESWRIYPMPDGTYKRVYSGGAVQVAADELSVNIELYRMDAERPEEDTCIAEVERLLADIMPVDKAPEVTDGPLPSLLIYDDSRVSAITDVLRAIDATDRMGPDGSLEVVPRSGAFLPGTDDPCWVIPAGPEGLMVSLERTLSDAGVYNGVISTGQTDTGYEIVGRAYINSGPLRWGGPYGMVPMFHSAIATTQPGVQRTAESMLRRREATGAIEMGIRCVAHPALQTYDRVRFSVPTLAGDKTLEGWVTGMDLGTTGDPSAPVVSKSMDLRVAVMDDDLETLAWEVSENVQ